LRENPPRRRSSSNDIADNQEIETLKSQIEKIKTLNKIVTHDHLRLSQTLMDANGDVSRQVSEAVE